MSREGRSAADRDRVRRPPASVLFVGNSLTYRGGGLDNHLKSLLPEIRTGRVVKGGATLERMLPLAEKEIRDGGWEAVVLQDDLPETTVDAFLGAASDGAALVRSAGACPYLLETWPYARLGWIDADGIIAAHALAAGETGAAVIPAGRAWRAALTDGGAPDLYDKDREHPSTAGSWLAALTTAAILIGGMPPEGIVIGESVPDGLGTEDAVFFRDIALRVCRTAVKERP